MEGPCSDSVSGKIYRVCLRLRGSEQKVPQAPTLASAQMIMWSGSVGPCSNSWPLGKFCNVYGPGIDSRSEEISRRPRLRFRIQTNRSCCSTYWLGRLCMCYVRFFHGLFNARCRIRNMHSNSLQFPPAAYYRPLSWQVSSGNPWIFLHSPCRALRVPLQTYQGRSFLRVPSTSNYMY